MKSKAISLGLAIALLIAVTIFYFFRFPSAQAQSSSSSSSSQPSPASPSAPAHVPMPPDMPQSIYAGLWRVDHSFEAKIHIKNLMTANSVQVTPVLFMADGTEYNLPPVSLAATAVADLSINQELGQVPPSIASHLSTYGSAALKYMCPAPGVVTGDITMMDDPRSLIFTDGFEMMMAMGQNSPAKQTLEGLWWKHDPNVGGFVNLTNTTSDSIKVSLRVIGAHGSSLSRRWVKLAPHAAQMLDLNELTGGLPDSEIQAGGVRVQWRGLMGDVIPVGGLENDSEGYSADMPIWPHNPKPSTGKEHTHTADEHHTSPASDLTLAAIGMMVGYPGPSMGFPRQTRFTAYLTLRNTTTKPMAITPVLYLADNGQSRSFSLPPEVLAPDETRQLDMAEHLTKLRLEDFNGFVNLTFSYSGAPGDLLMAAGSVDQTGTYVFPVLPQGVNQSMAKDVPGWTVANGYDTMFTLWNSSDSAEDLIATFHYADGSGQYKLPVHLEAHASMNIDMAMLLMNQRPDTDGNILPAGATEGSVTFSSTAGMKGMIQLGLNAAEFNVTTATCCNCCICCCGTTSIIICPDPGYCPIGIPEQMYADEYYMDGGYTDITAEANWSSQDPSIATVGNSSNNSGLTTGVALGETLLDAYTETFPGGQICNCYGYCPGDEQMGGQGYVYVDSSVFSITSGGVPNDSQGVIAKQSFNLKIQAKNAQGTVPDTTFNEQNVPFTLASMNTSLGESAPSSVNFSSGTANASVTIVQASGTESAPSSVRQITVGSSTFQPIVYFEVMMDVERWQNCGFVSCPNAGSYFCTTSCDSNGFASPTAFVAITESGLCGKGIVIETSGGGGLTSTTIQDCGPASGGGCSNPYWFTGSIPTMGGCLSDALATQMGIANGCNPGAYGQATVLWRFQ